METRASADSGGRASTPACSPFPPTAFANFMRSTKAPSRGKIDQTVLAGETLFRQIGCSTCHVPSITTAPEGTVINGGMLIVRPAVGGKVIHPFSDFLLHDIATGDG